MADKKVVNLEVYDKDGFSLPEYLEVDVAFFLNSGFAKVVKVDPKKDDKE